MHKKLLFFMLHTFIFINIFLSFILKNLSKVTSSMVEHLAYNEEVTGSNPVLPI